MVKCLSVDIIHMDASLIVIDKPAGLSVLADGWEADSIHVMQLLEAEFGRIWVVHRLDKGTSGVLVAARTEAAHRALSRQFERHEATKLYHAIVCGSPEWEERTTRNPLRLDVGHKHRTVIDQSRGKPSTTTFHVLERLRDHALLEVHPLTGRTHQVRAHAAALHLPLLGDLLYGAPPTAIIERPALHAIALTITHPESGLAVTFSAPHPADFDAALAALRTKKRKEKSERRAP
jgi:RluA family pseudouridine synthase